MNLRKNLLVLIFILAVAIISILLIELEVISPKKSSQVIGFEQEKNTEPEAVLTTLSQNGVINPTISRDGKGIKFYEKNTGYAFSIDFDGNNETKISSNKLLSLYKIIWSPTKQEVIGFFNDSGGLRKTYYSYITQKASNLEKNIYDLAFSPQGDKIVYSLYDSASEAGGIYISKPDGTNPVKILSTRIQNLRVSWANNDFIYTYKESSNEGVDIFVLSVDGKIFEKIIRNVFNPAINLSSEPYTLIFSSTNERGEEKNLFLYESGAKTNLEFSGDPENCAWSYDKENIYCSDGKEITKINTQTGDKTKIYENSNIRPSQLLVSPLENYLVFVNSRDGFVYSLKLDIKTE